MNLSLGRIDIASPKPRSAGAGGEPKQFRLSDAAKPASEAPVPSQAENSASLQMAPMLLAQATRKSAPVAPGGAWPTGAGEDSLSSKFRNATPLKLRDIAPHGMKIPVEVGYDIVTPTENGRHAARDLGKLSVLGFGRFATNLLSNFVSGKGEDQKISKGDSNKLLESLMDSSKSSIEIGEEFRSKSINQIKDTIQNQIARTGETSGSVRGGTSWETTSDFTFRNSLGSFSAKLLYDVSYSKKEDGSIDVSGDVALAVQDLYDFSNKMLPLSIPTWLLPKDFMNRPNHRDKEGSLTDVALATLQREGIASPFYVYGVSDIAKIKMDIGPRFVEEWSVER